ncbi:MULTISPECIES: hypothetical protein [Agrobacterium]|uniref:Ribbon-helix-helix protein CopG domain-containing protein n=1 Tax=Agrobacterium rosae TaxID=1972867 RepID=A0A1R3TZQ9_9HYPH|nr:MULTISPECIES: hypothetical protein [Agrobacterium]MBN7804690.1 hypothetical protein [Agrobacterium rosae]MDX8303331.1 hypothetical protein [Agrobacterium rosae]MDX8315643.1 hypothetical protein [Agrobacterium rosae]SCX25108.1 hypothetical protein DSM25558_3699 [Agrobacterium sp. DSM 25558]SCX33570.1 hypothetical protein DSM25559_4208 [Agrobacterium rosae]
MNFTHEIETALAAYSQETNLGRDEAIQRILREWLVREGFLFSGEEGIHPAKLNASNDD